MLRVQRVDSAYWAVAVNVVGMLPIYLVAATAADVAEALGSGPEVLGFAAALFFSVSAGLMGPSALVVRRVGHRRGMGLSATLAAVSMVGIGVSSGSLLMLSALAVGGFGNAVAQPAVNVGIMRFARDGKMAFAFGLKQAAIPLATLLSGLSVPVVALVVGWRWTFVSGSCVAVIAAVMCIMGSGSGGGSPPAPRRRRSERRFHGPILVATFGAALGAAASTSLGVFLVVSATQVGIDKAAAGFLFSGCSVLVLVNRIGMGWIIDRTTNRNTYVIVANMMLIGAVGFFLLGSSHVTWFVIGSFIAYGAGWAWQGVFEYAMLQYEQLSPAAATGVAQTGLCLGAAGGPLLFGVVAKTAGFDVAWFIAGGMILFGMAMIRSSVRMMAR